MPDLARRAIIIAIGLFLYAVGGKSFDAAGGFSPDNHLGALTFVTYLAGIALAAFGAFGPMRKRP